MIENLHRNFMGTFLELLLAITLGLSKLLLMLGGVASSPSGHWKAHQRNSHLLGSARIYFCGSQFIFSIHEGVCKNWNWKIISQKGLTKSWCFPMWIIKIKTGLNICHSFILHSTLLSVSQLSTAELNVACTLRGPIYSALKWMDW